MIKIVFWLIKKYFGKSEKKWEHKKSKILWGKAMIFFLCISRLTKKKFNILIDIECLWAADSNEKIKKGPPGSSFRDMSWRNEF